MKMCKLKQKMSLRHRKSGYVDENVSISQFDGVAIDTGIRLLGELAGGYVILPTVPRACHQRADQVTFAQRAAMMQAYTIDCKQLTFDIGYGNRFASDLEFADLPRQNLFLFGGALERHGKAPGSKAPEYICDGCVSQTRTGVLCTEGKMLHSRLTWVFVHSSLHLVLGRKSVVQLAAFPTELRSRHCVKLD